MSFQLPVQVSGVKRAFLGRLNGSRVESFSARDIIRASLIAGHPKHGPSLVWRITAWREACIRLALDLPLGRPRRSRGLTHPRAWGNLEQSEKAGISNILGNTVPKLLSERLLNAPRMWFLDLYGEEFN